MTTVAAAPKALVLGIDGASFDIIDSLVADGFLPYLSELLRRGASARTTCTWPAHTAPGWSSYVTARQPGGHGIYQFFDTAAADYGARILRSGDLGCDSAWDWLAAQGWTLGLVNVPMSHPPRDLPGYQVTWPLEQTLGYSRPRSLLAELAAHGAHFQSDLATMFRGDLGYLDEAVANVEARTRSVEYLLRAHPTDLVMVVLTEADRVCHHYWHFADPAHPRHAAAPEGTGWQDAIRRVYGAIDEAIGRLVAAVGDETVISVVSDHGLGVGRYGLAVHRLLAEAGLLATTTAGGGPPVASWFGTGSRTVDFGRTRAYLPVPGSYGISLNLAGRQRDGVVAAADRAAVQADVVDLLEDVSVPGGGRAFAAVLPAAVAYPGPYADRAPDLLLVPRDETVLPVADVAGPVWTPSWQTGLHRYAGMWIQVAPGTRPGRLPHPVRLVDLMPTLLAELGAGWPAGVHGRPVDVALDPAVPLPASLSMSPPAAGGPAGGGPAGRAGPAACGGEDEYTSRRLREMGYL